MDDLLALSIEIQKTKLEPHPEQTQMQFESEPQSAPKPQPRYQAPPRRLILLHMPVGEWLRTEISRRCGRPITAVSVALTNFKAQGLVEHKKGVWRKCAKAVL